MLDKLRKNKALQYFCEKAEQPHIIISTMIIVVILANIFTDQSYEAVSASIVQHLKKNSNRCVTPKTPLVITTNDLQIKNVLSYDCQMLHGLAFEIKNISDKNIEVSSEFITRTLEAESLFVDIPEQNNISPGESVKAYIVYKRLLKAKKFRDSYLQESKS